MGNYRQRLMAAGCPEVLVNKKKKRQANSKAIKKSKKGEIHFLTDPPNGQSAVTSEEKRKIMILELNAEFSRIVTTDLMQSFLDGIDDLVPSLLEPYKVSSKRLMLSSVMQCLHKEAESLCFTLLNFNLQFQLPQPNSQERIKPRRKGTTGIHAWPALQAICKLCRFCKRSMA
ncbi:hypothetical protein SRHO_G00249590 [Serrasalmus rhombeus]